MSHKEILLLGFSRCIFRFSYKPKLLLVSSGGSASTSTFEFAALGPNERLNMRVGLSCGAEGTDGLPLFAGSLEQKSVLASGGLQGQLVEGQDLASGLEDALTGLLGHVKSADLQ